MVDKVWEQPLLVKIRVPSRKKIVDLQNSRHFDLFSDKFRVSPSLQKTTEKRLRSWSNAKTLNVVVVAISFSFRRDFYLLQVTSSTSVFVTKLNSNLKKDFFSFPELKNFWFSAVEKNNKNWTEVHEQHVCDLSALLHRRRGLRKQALNLAKK